MFKHEQYLKYYLDNYTDQIITDTLIPNTKPVIGYPRYEIIGIHKLTPEENDGKHNLYIDVVSKDGKRINEMIDWGWEGQTEAEKLRTKPVSLDKPSNEPAGDIVIFWGQKIFAKVYGKTSDEVYNIHTMLPDEAPGNTRGHHSYYVVWMLAENENPNPEPDPGSQNCEELRLENTKLKSELENAEEALDSIQEILNSWYDK